LVDVGRAGAKPGAQQGERRQKKWGSVSCQGKGMKTWGPVCKYPFKGGKKKNIKKNNAVRTQPEVSNVPTERG